MAYFGTKKTMLIGLKGEDKIAGKETVTIQASAWSDNSATVSVSGVTQSNSIFVTASPNSYSAYATAQIRCTEQGNGTLTFACEETPKTDISVNILIFN